ncbi:MAG: hypothetical protein R6V85_06355 [Polyangia bacterium]
MEPWMLAVVAAVVIGLIFVMRKAGAGLSAQREAQVRAAWQQDQRKMVETPLYHRILEPAMALNRDHLQDYAAAQQIYGEGVGRGVGRQDAAQVTKGLKGMRAHLAAAISKGREVVAALSGEDSWQPVDGSTPPDTSYRPPRPPPSGTRNARWELQSEIVALAAAIGELGPHYAAFWNSFLEADEAAQRASAIEPARKCVEALELGLERLSVIEDRLRT